LPVPGVERGPEHGIGQQSRAPGESRNVTVAPGIGAPLSASDTTPLKVTCGSSCIAKFTGVPPSTRAG